jgi:hypothetical protein
MRAGKILTAMMFGFLLPCTVRADVLQVAGGGGLKGTLTEVTVLVKDKEVTRARTDIKKIKLVRSGRIVLTQEDGSRLRGELVSLKFKSLAGELTFERSNVVSLKLVSDPLAAARKEFAEKRAAADDDDAGALLKLAEWCDGRGLKTEAVRCARQCLAAKPDAEAAEKAHKLLGHVQYKGQWMAPADALKKRQEEGDSDSPDDETDDTESPATSTKEKFAAGVRQNAALYETFKQRIQDAKDKELGALKKEYSKKWDDTEVLIKTLTAEIKEREKARASERETHRKELQAAHHTKAEIEDLLKARFDDFNSAYNKKIRAVREARLKAKVERGRLAGIIKPLRGKIARKASQAKAGTRLVFQRHERILRDGKLLTEEQMMKAFEAGLAKNS